MNKLMRITVIVLGAILAILIILNLVTKREMETEVLINASKERVWSVLTDIDKYGEWNPFMTSVKGDLKLNGQLTNVMVNDGQATTFTPIITEFEENKTLEWLGSAMGGLFKGRHYFHLQDTNDGNTKMIHGEKFSGLLSGLVMMMIGSDTHGNFIRMNDAMKKRVETLN